LLLPLVDIEDFAREDFFGVSGDEDGVWRGVGSHKRIIADIGILSGWF